MANKPQRSQYDEVRRRIESKYKAQQEFFTHAIAFVFVNLMLWGLWVFNPDDHSGFPWPAWVTLGWGIGLIAHFLEFYRKTALQDRIDRETMRELERRGIDPEAAARYEKPKRQQMRLTDDGELAPIADDSTPANEDYAYDDEDDNRSARRRERRNRH